jgi:hypothetical protein
VTDPVCKIFLFGLILSGCWLPGCAGWNSIFSAGVGSAMETYVADDFPEQLSARIAEDIAERLVSGYPPGRTKLYLTIYIVGQGLGPIAQTVEDRLRTRGFTILPEPDSEAEAVAWRIDRIDERTWYLTVSLSSGYRFSRLYDYDGQVLKPIGLLSQGVF